MTLLLAAAALVAPVVPAFAPPLARDIVYETEQVRRVAGEAQRYRMVNRLAFARMPGGWRLTLTLVDISTTARADAAALFEAGMRPFLDTAIVMRLDPDGRPATALDVERTWTAISASLARVADTLAARASGGADSAAVRTTRAWFAAFAALDGPAREAKLLEAADALIGFALPALRPGESAPWQTTGRITLAAADGDTASYRFTTTTALPQAGGTLAEEGDFAIDRATGLLVESRTVKRLGDAVLAEETIRRIR